MWIPLIALFAVTNFYEQMSTEELNQTGVIRLTLSERSALENWVEKHCRLYCQQQTEQENKELSLFTNLEGGRKLELSDGTLYEVAPDDLVISSSWLTPFSLRIETSGDPEYPLQIVNIQTGRKVRVKRLS